MAHCETGQCPPSEDPLDPSTFTPPIRVSEGASQAPSVVIEFCNRCRWLHRATWVQTELFLTFPDTSTEKPSEEEQQQQHSGGGSKYETGGKGLKSITLIPCSAPDTGGRFRIWLYKGESGEPESSEQQQQTTSDAGKVIMLWDRKIKAGFPELKELKQLIRDEIAPSHKLGHSDKKKGTK